MEFKSEVDKIDIVQQYKNRKIIIKSIYYYLLRSKKLIFIIKIKNGIEKLFFDYKPWLNGEYKLVLKVKITVPTLFMKKYT